MSNSLEQQDFSNAPTPEFDLDLASELKNGGRALNAVNESRNLCSIEKHILLVMGSQLNYTGTFTEYRWTAISRLIYLTSYSESTVKKSLKSLIEKGYLEKQYRFSETNKQQANSYRITKKIFEEYYAILVDKSVRKQASNIIKIRGSSENPMSLCGGREKTPQGGAKKPHRGSPHNPELLHKNSTQKAPSVFNANGGSAPTPPQKISHKEMAEVRKMGAALFVKAERQRNGFERNITKEEKNALMEECLKDFGIEPIRLFYDKVKQEQNLGEIPFHHQTFRNFIQEIIDGKIDLTPRKLKQPEDEFDAFFTNFDEEPDSSAMN